METERSRPIDELIQALKVNDALYEQEGVPEEPREVMNALIKIGKPAVEPLLELLKDTETWSHSYAIKVLGQIGAEEAIEPLIELIDGEYFYGFDEAIWALQKIGLRAVEPMLHYLKNKRDKEETENIISALEVLKKIKDERAYQALVDTLSYPDEKIQEATIASLGEYGDERAVEPLSKFLEDEDLRHEQRRPGGG